MAEAAFDTLAMARRLREGGFDEGRAEAIALAIREGVTGGVATKADLKSEIASVRGEVASVRGEIDKAKFDLTWRLLGGVAVLNGLLFLALRGVS